MWLTLIIFIFNIISCYSSVKLIIGTEINALKVTVAQNSDTDGVYDDIRALTIALNHPKVEILAITTVHGGVNANQSAANVARLLRATGKSIPIYIGAQDSLVPKGPIEVWEELFGSDGIGGVPNSPPKSLPSDFSIAHVKSAIEAIIDLIEHSSVNVTLVALGPLTNIAMAIRKNPKIAQKIEKIVIMGGNYMGVGNTLSNSTAEFNFLMDPEAAEIVLNSLHSVIVPWDTCFFKGPEYKELVDYEESLHQNTSLSYFLSNITEKGRIYNRKIHQQYAFVDDIAVAIAIDPSVLIKKIKLCARVELEMGVTRGQVTVDWLSTAFNPENGAFEAIAEKNEQHWLSQTFVTEFDVRKVNKMLVEAVRSAKTPIDFQ